MAKTSLEMPYLAVIPYAVMSDKDLPANAKIHYGCLAGLAKKEGYCWATNEQFAEMHGVSERQIIRWNNALEEKGLIKRTYKNVPYRNEENKFLWKTTRKIYINDGFSKNIYGDEENVPAEEPDKNVPAEEPDKNVTHKDKPLKEKSIKEKVASPSALRLSTFLFEKIKKRNPQFPTPNLENWAREIDKLLNESPTRKDPYTLEQVESIIEWAQNDDFWHTNILSGKKLREKMDDLVIKMKGQTKSKQVVRKQKEEEKLALIEKNKQIATIIIEENKNKFKQGSYIQWFNGVTGSIVAVEIVINNNRIPPIGFLEDDFESKLNHWICKL